MTSINDIELADIKSFLINNDINPTILGNKDKIYQIVENGILSGRFENFSDVIIDWIIARNLLNDNIDLRTYKLSEINNMSDNELILLYQFLSDGENIKDKGAMRKSVINILKFLHKLQFDVTNLSSLQADVFTNILRASDTNQIQNLCNSSKNFKKKCNSNEARIILIDKIKATGDNLDLSDFNNDDLIKYLQILPYKKDSNISGARHGNVQYLKVRKYWFALGNERIYLNSNDINQIVGYTRDEAAALTTDGKLKIINLETDQIYDQFQLPNWKSRQYETIQFNHKNWAIFKAAGNAFIVLTSNGEYYYFSVDMFGKEVRILRNIILFPNESTSIRDYMSGYYRPEGF